MITYHKYWVAVIAIAGLIVLEIVFYNKSRAKGREALPRFYLPL